MQKEVRAFEDKLRSLFFELYSKIKTPEAELKAVFHKRHIQNVKARIPPQRYVLSQFRTPPPSNYAKQKQSFSSQGKAKLQTSLMQLDHQIKRIAAGHNDALNIEISPKRLDSYSPEEVRSPLPQYSYTTGRIEETALLPSINEMSLVDKAQENESARLQRKFEATSQKIKQFADHLDNLKVYTKVHSGKIAGHNRDDLVGALKSQTRRHGVILDKAVRFRSKTKASRVKDSGSSTPIKRARSVTVEPIVKGPSMPKPRIKRKPKSFQEVQTEQDSKLNLLLSRIEQDRSKKLTEKLHLLQKTHGYGADQDLASVRRLQEKRRQKRALDNRKQQTIYSRAVFNLRYVAHELTENVKSVINYMKVLLEAGEVLKEKEFIAILELAGQLTDEDSQKTVKSILRQFGIRDSIIS